MSLFHRSAEWIKYRWKAHSRHGVHSPFVYHFIENALYHRSGKLLQQTILQYFNGYETRWNDWELKTDIQENTLIILKDIHQNKTNTQQWRTLISHPRVRLSMDLYDYGLLFFKKDFLEKQHFVLKR